MLFRSMSHDLWQALRLSRLTTAAIPLLGLWPTIFLFAWLEPFFLCATAGVAVAVTHRKCQVSLVLLYAAASFAFCVWIGMNHLRTIQECACNCEFAVAALAGSLAGGFLGCALHHPTFRRPYWASQLDQ